ALEPALDGVLGAESRSDHHGRVGRVRAARDRGDDDASVLELVVLALDLDALPLRLERRHGGGLTILGRVACRHVARGEAVCDLLVVGPVPVRDAERPERLDERLLRLAQWHAVLRAARPGQARLDVAEVELDHLRVLRLLARLVPEPGLLAVGLDERALSPAAAGQLEV